MEEIYIFDIDGCVLPPIFSNFIGKHSSREKLVVDIEKNGYKIPLFPEFLTFYEKKCKNARSVIFITGRKENEFGNLTQSQLKPLEHIKSYKVIYYPEEKEHRAQEYYDWKVDQINKILKAEIEKKKFDINQNSNLKVKIYDDMVKYFPRLKKKAKLLELELELFKIKGKKSWIPLLKN